MTQLRRFFRDHLRPHVPLMAGSAVLLLLAGLCQGALIASIKFVFDDGKSRALHLPQPGLFGHLEHLRDAVVSNGADAGIAHDGDADRCLAIDQLGRDVDGDQIMAVLALAFRDRHDELTGLFRIRLDHAMNGVYAVQHQIPSHPARAHQSAAYRALHDAVAGVRAIDQWYVAELDRLYLELEVEGGVNTSEVIGWHRAEIRTLQNDCVAWVLPGGNIRTLMSVLRLFAVTIPPEVPVIGWSAGAMALTERIAIFHDYGPDGARETELFDTGLGRVRGLVAFPHARRRLRMDAPDRLGILAMRFAPAQCVLLDDGVILDIGPDGLIPDVARRVGGDGLIRSGEEALA